LPERLAELGVLDPQPVEKADHLGVEFAALSEPGPGMVALVVLRA
jgi:hypothetical protein